MPGARPGGVRYPPQAWRRRVLRSVYGGDRSGWPGPPPPPLALGQLLVACGGGAGLAAVYNVPLAGGHDASAGYGPAVPVTGSKLAPLS